MPFVPDHHHHRPPPSRFGLMKSERRVPLHRSPGSPRISSSNRHLACSGSFVLDQETTRVIANIPSRLKLDEAGSLSHSFSKQHHVGIKPLLSESSHNFHCKSTQATTRPPQLIVALAHTAEPCLKKTFRTLSVCAGPRAPLVLCNRTGREPPFCCPLRAL